MNKILLLLLLSNAAFANQSLYDVLSGGRDFQLLEILENDPTVDLNFISSDGNSILIQAAKSARGFFIQYLLRQPGIDLDVVDNNGRSALSIASKRNSVTSAVMLAEAGAELNSRDERGRTALMNTLLQDEEETIAYALIRAGADLGISSLNNRSFPLIAATDLNRYGGGLIHAFAKAGANLEQTNNIGETALMYAIGWGSEFSAKALLDAGANPNTRNPIHGNTALFEAVLGSWLSTAIQQLIAAGADVNARNYKGATAVFSAIGNNMEENIRILSAYGADLNTTKKDGTSVLGYARKKGNQEIIDLLINLGAKD
jgi:serine/threonine-protein phosphatase 6 regulatory ankyrin repeat subunit A